MSSVWVEVLGQPGGNDDSVAALWGFWLIRIRRDQAIVRVAQCVASLAATNADALDKLRSKIAIALGPGAEDGQLFAENYFEHQCSAAGASAKP